MCKRFLKIKTKEKSQQVSVTTKLVFLYEFVNPKGGGGGNSSAVERFRLQIIGFGQLETGKVVITISCGIWLRIEKEIVDSSQESNR